jgi:hypothetical protein
MVVQACNERGLNAKECQMENSRSCGLQLFVDRARRQWIARDAQGRYWMLPCSDRAWEDRIEVRQRDFTELEPVPTHYKATLCLP